VYALGAIERGRELADIASSMRLPVARVRELVRLARDRRELRSYDKRPLLADAQWFINVELAKTPGLTRAEIAHRMGMHPSDFDRTFGDAKAGRRRRRFITVTMGDRLMLALGRDPRELDGC
jgi:hypothetical protein